MFIISYYFFGVFFDVMSSESTIPTLEATAWFLGLLGKYKWSKPNGALGVGSFSGSTMAEPAIHSVATFSFGKELTGLAPVVCAAILRVVLCILDDSRFSTEWCLVRRRQWKLKR